MWRQMETSGYYFSYTMYEGVCICMRCEYIYQYILSKQGTM